MKPFLNAPRPLNIAHRGSMGIAPENTLRAFEIAIAQRCDVLELDVHPSLDGEAVVIHDSSVDRTTNGHGMVKKLTFNDIKRLDAGYRFTTDHGNTFPYRGKGLSVPALEEVFRAFPEQRINIEVKDLGCGIEQKIFNLTKKYGMQKKVLLAAESAACSRALRIQSPEIAFSASYNEVCWFFILLCVKACFLFHANVDAFQVPEYYGKIHLVTPRFIQEAHKRGIKVHVWTVNDESDMERLLDWGVDGIITDYPDRLGALIEKLY